MKTFLTSFLLVVGSVVLPSPVSAQTSTVVGTVRPAGKGFVVMVDERAVHVAMPPAPAMPNARVAVPSNADLAAQVAVPSNADLAAQVRREATRKLAELFPDGVPPAVAARIKITVTVKLTRPPEIGLSVQW